jgi:hypothetical protein
MYKVLATKIIYLKVPTLSDEVASPSIASHDIVLGGSILVVCRILGAIGTCMSKPNLIPMRPTVVVIFGFL